VTRFAHELRSPTESDEYTNVYYVTDPPRKRDFFRVLFGRYTPQVRRVERLTVKGMITNSSERGPPTPCASSSTALRF
jgi:hypothetical protein